MPPVDYLELDDEGLLKQCHVDCYRSSGPGGQKKNKTSSAVRLRHQPTGLIVTATEERSQHVNKKRAIRRLRDAIALNIRREVDLESYSPSELIATYTDRAGRIAINCKNDDYCHLVREVLDILVACQMQVSQAATHLGISTSQLVAFFQNDDRLWGRVNHLRTEVGQKPLR